MGGVEFLDQLPAELDKKMENGLSEYANTHGVNVGFEKFCFVKRIDNEVVGILDAFYSYGCIHIVDIWVDKAHRGNGYGKELIKAIEQYATENGAQNINLITCDYQAPDFYKKCGYKIEFIRENKQNPNLAMTFFIKWLDR